MGSKDALLRSRWSVSLDLYVNTTMIGFVYVLWKRIDNSVRVRVERTKPLAGVYRRWQGGSTNGKFSFSSRIILLYSFHTSVIQRNGEECALCIGAFCVDIYCTRCYFTRCYCEYDPFSVKFVGIQATRSAESDMQPNIEESINGNSHFQATILHSYHASVNLQQSSRDRAS
jgi:hypothetical protein